MARVEDRKRLMIRAMLRDGGPEREACLLDLSSGGLMPDPRPGGAPTTTSRAPRARQWLALGALGNAVVAATWLVSRTVALPFGQFAHLVLPVGFSDSVATILAAVTVIGAAVLGGLFAGIYGLNAKQLDQVFSGVTSRDLGLI